jgi:hypothetical protein
MKCDFISGVFARQMVLPRMLRGCVKDRYEYIEAPDWEEADESGADDLLDIGT